MDVRKRRSFPSLHHLRLQMSLTIVALLALLGACGGAGGSATSSAPAGGASNEAESPTIAARPDPEPAVSSQDFPMTVTDWTGHKETFDQAPAKVAVLSGTPLNLWYDVSGTAVATSTLSKSTHISPDHEAEIREVPELGEPFNLDAEKLVEIDPDLVITMYGMQDTLTSQLQQLGYPTLTVRTNDLDDLASVYEIFGALNGTSDVASDHMDQITTEAADVTDKYPASGESAVILFQSEKSLSVKLDNSIAGSMLNELGVTNIASGMRREGSDSAVLDLEEIVKQQPDFVLVTGRFTDPDRAQETMESEFEKNPAWQSIDAVAEDRVIYLPQEYFLYNAGPEYSQALTLLASSLHPEVYGATEEP